LDAAAELAAAWAAPLALALDAEVAALAAELAAAEFAAAWAAPLALALEADLAAFTDCETLLVRAASKPGGIVTTCGGAATAEAAVR
jgi:hypothetical protein